MLRAQLLTFSCFLALLSAGLGSSAMSMVLQRGSWATLRQHSEIFWGKCCQVQPAGRHPASKSAWAPGAKSSCTAPYVIKLSQLERSPIFFVTRGFTYKAPSPLTVRKRPSHSRSSVVDVTMALPEPGSPAILSVTGTPTGWRTVCHPGGPARTSRS